MVGSLWGLRWGQRPTGSKMSDNEQILKTVGDATAVGTAWGAFLTNNLPTLALVLSIVWTLLRIYETETIQGFVDKVFRRKGDDEGTE